MTCPNCHNHVKMVGHAFVISFKTLALAMQIKHILFLLFFPLGSLAQNVLVPLYQSGRRIDDFVMRNNGLGFLASNDPYQVMRTTDGGQNFSSVLTGANMGGEPYLRSLRTMGDSVVFVGTLTDNHTLYRSLDAGTTWQNITPNLPDTVNALCGLAVVGDSVIYGTGRFFGDAYLIRSSDSGATWRYIDMKPWASNLIDVHFFTARHGYVVGRSANPNQGAILLETRTGGLSWTVKWTSNVAGDRAWKFFMRDPANFYVSIENSQNIPNRYYFSTDSGSTWQLDTLGNWSFPMLQSVAFINADTGFAGGHFQGYLYTYDGGENWQYSLQYQGFNRMQKVGDRMFIAGRGFSYFGPATGVSLKPPLAPPPALHQLKKVYPQPLSAGETLRVQFQAGHLTNVGFALTDLMGRTVYEWPNMQAEQGENTFSLLMPGVAAGTYLLQAFTDIEHHQQKLLIR